MDWLKQSLKFGTVGVLNTAIDFGVLNFLTLIWHWPLLIANSLAFIVAVTNSYFMNKYWTFAKRDSFKMDEFVRFLVISVGGLAVSNLAVWLLAMHYHLSPNLAKALSVGAVFVWNFLGSKYLAFRVE